VIEIVDDDHSRRVAAARGAARDAREAYIIGEPESGEAERCRVHARCIGADDKETFEAVGLQVRDRRRFGRHWLHHTLTGRPLQQDDAAAMLNVGRRASGRSFPFHRTPFKSLTRPLAAFLFARVLKPYPLTQNASQRLAQAIYEDVAAVSIPVSFKIEGQPDVIDVGYAACGRLPAKRRRMAS